MRQAAADVQPKVSDVDVQGLLGLATAEAAAGQAGQDLFAQRFSQLVELAADGRFMDAQHSGNVGQGTSIQKIRGQDQSIFAGERGQSLVGCGFQLGVGRCHGLRLGSLKLDSFFILFIKADEALLAAIAIYIFLREHGAQPAFERSAASVGRKLA